MNKDELIKWALIAVGGYLVWEYVIKPMMNPAAPAVPAPTQQTITSPMAATMAPGAPVQPSPSASTSAPAPATVVTGGSNVPVWMTSLPALANALHAAAGSDSQSVDQWVYYYNNFRSQRGMPALTSDQLIALLSSFGFPADSSAARSTAISSTQFVNAIFGLGLGLQGLGEIVNIAPRKMSMNFGGGMGALARTRGFGGKGLVN